MRRRTPRSHPLRAAATSSPRPIRPGGGRLVITPVNPVSRVFGGHVAPGRSMREPDLLADRILGQLTNKPLSPRTLAVLCDAKEFVVDQALSLLAHAGRIRPGDMPDGGARDRVWRIVE